LERDQIEESASVVEGNAVLYVDQLGGSRPVFEHALFDLFRSIGGADQQTGCIGYRVPHALDDGAQITLVVFDG